MASSDRQPPFPHLDDLRRAYDHYASQRNAIEDLQWRTGVLERWLEELPRAPRLLELGPGTGQLASHAERLGARVHAIDLSAQNVAYCRQRGISAEVGDFRALRHIDGLGRFDGVYAINALLHVPRAEHASVIAGVRQRLVPGGGLLLVNWGGHDVEGVWAEDSCDPPRFFSQYDDAGFFALAFEGFEVVRREIVPDHAPDGLHPQLLALRNVMTAYAFTSPRLAMRPWRATDLAAFHQIFGDPRVIWWGKHKRDLGESRAGLERAIQEQDSPITGLGRFAVESLGTQAVIGNVVLRPASSAEGIEVGYHFACAAWGCGYATEAARAALEYAFFTIGLDRVVAAVALQNAPSLRIMEKLGMSPTEEREQGGLAHRMFECRRERWLVLSASDSSGRAGSP